MQNSMKYPNQLFKNLTDATDKHVQHWSTLWIQDVDTHAVTDRRDQTLEGNDCKHWKKIAANIDVVSWYSI